MNGTVKDSLAYTYDNNGNITEIKNGNTVLAKYTYDGLNQLIREDNAVLNRSYVFTYDTAGNILSKKEYAYTTGTLGTVLTTKTYAYATSGWKDRLTKFDGESIEYDALGNPTTYRGYDLTWNLVRNLTGFGNHVFSYNASGIRTGKDDITYEYDGDKIVREIRPNAVLRYFYDTIGVCGFQYSNNNYYFMRNMQGDITAIYDTDGNIMAEYVYDAWGNHTITTDIGGIGTLNPFRYRGYYFDTETGLYYLKSRYYDPQTGRFINADIVIAGVGGSIQGYNMFSYGFNNPVNMDDQTGHWPKWVKNTVKWATKNIANPVVKMVQKVLSKVNVTYSQGINVSGTPSAFIFNLQAGISIDAKGNVAIQGSFGGGFTGGSPGASITAYRSVTTAPSIYKLNGLGYQIGGSVGIPVQGIPLAVGGDFNIIPDDILNTIYLGATTNVGFGTPGGEFHVEWGETATWTATQFNIFDVAENIYIKIMEW